MAIKESPSASIAAEESQIAKAVLMSGDPLRAKYVADHYLEEVVCFNTVRNMLGYTGTYKGKRISVMGHGMGVPSMGIYSYELYQFFGVDTIIRIGSAGAMTAKLKLRDVVAAQAACTNSNYMAQFGMPGTFAPIASWELLKQAVKAAEENGAVYHVGNVNSSDVFYGDHALVPEGLDSLYGLKKMGVMALEMEAAALYMNAARYGKRALCICTISDHILTGEDTTSEQRQNSFTTMMKVALDTAVAMENK